LPGHASWYISSAMKPDRQRLIKSDPSGLPAYPIREAAHYLRIPVGTLRYWALGGPCSRSDGQHVSEPILTLPDRSRPILSFMNLMEAHVLAAIRRRYQISFPKVRSAVTFIKEKLPTKYPLADHQFATDGLHLFIEHLGKLINVTGRGQLAIRELLEVHLRRIDRDPHGIPIRLYPFTRDPEADEPRAVVIDPRISFGRPVLAGTGIATVIVAERFNAGESMEDLAVDYGRGRSDIEEAIRCELALPKAA